MQQESKGFLKIKQSSWWWWLFRGGRLSGRSAGEGLNPNLDGEILFRSFCWARERELRFATKFKTLKAAHHLL